MIQPTRVRALVIAVALAAGVTMFAQGRGQQAPAAAPQTPQAAAPLDLEGYWVSVVTEDWRWRMMTPPKGDAPGVPLSVAGRKLADSWDLAKDNATGNQCKAYGAAGIMRIPGRLHITWQDGSTLKVEFDAGRQTRLYRFLGPLGEAPRNEPRSLQGFTTASWTGRNTGAPILNEEQPPNAAGRGGRGGRGPAGPQKGSLKAITKYMRAGYFRKNGLPYSENATLTEYFDRHSDFGAEWLTVLSVLDESTYLVSPFVTTTHFKREPDGSKWNPQPCETLPPTAPLSKGEAVG